MLFRYKTMEDSIIFKLREIAEYAKGSKIDIIQRIIAADDEKSFEMILPLVLLDKLMYSRKSVFMDIMKHSSRRCFMLLPRMSPFLYGSAWNREILRTDDDTYYPMIDIIINGQNFWQELVSDELAYLIRHNDLELIEKLLQIDGCKKLFTEKFMHNMLITDKYDVLKLLEKYGIVPTGTDVYLAIIEILRQHSYDASSKFCTIEFDVFHRILASDIKFEMSQIQLQRIMVRYVCGYNTGSQEIVSLMIERGMDINYMTQGASCLALAISYGKLNIVRSMLFHGAKVTVGDSEISALGHVIESGMDEKIFKVILEYSLDIPYPLIFTENKDLQKFSQLYMRLSNEVVAEKIAIMMANARDDGFAATQDAIEQSMKLLATLQEKTMQLEYVPKGKVFVLAEERYQAAAEMDTGFDED